MKFETLKILGIPYEIEYSDQLVKNLMRIAESRPFFLEHLTKPLKVSLLRNAKIRAITYSNQIEGNTLSEEKVSKLLQKKKKELNDSEVLEIQNYADALNYAEKLAIDPRPLKISDFCDLQRLVTEGLIQKDQLGKLRTIPVSIVNALTGEKIDSCPEPHHLKLAIDDLWKWLEYTKEMNPFLRAFAFHFIAVSVHPFVDGNGRTCRLMQHLLLLQAGEEIVRYVPSETAIMHNRDEYYKVIRQTKKLGKLTPILEFLSLCFADSADKVTSEAKYILKTTELNPTIRQDKIVNLAKRKKEIKASDVISLFPDVPRRTLERDLEILCKVKRLHALGKNRARVYRIK
jgi:Fic family protein